jgi:hypothetical protein
MFQDHRWNLIIDAALLFASCLPGRGNLPGTGNRNRYEIGNVGKTVSYKEPVSYPNQVFRFVRGKKDYRY